jgi:hypothetical protein
MSFVGNANISLQFSLRKGAQASGKYENQWFENEELLESSRFL